MKHLFCSYELSIKLKEVGFKELCLAAYDRIEMLCSHSETVFEPLNYNNSGNYTSAPLYQQVIDFLREKHGYVVNAYANASGYCFEIHDSAVRGGTHRWDSAFEGPNESGCWDDYYEALTSGINKALSIIKY